jgi:hypothetical protein
MDFSGYSHSELANITRDLINEFHARHANLPESAFKVGVGKRLGVAHRSLDILREHVRDGGLITPQSGGDPKTPPGP